MNNKVLGVAITATLSADLAFSTYVSETVSKIEAQTLANENDKFKVGYGIDDKGKVLNIRIPDGVVDIETKQKLTKEMGNWTFEAGSPETDVTSMVTLEKL